MDIYSPSSSSSCPELYSHAGNISIANMTASAAELNHVILLHYDHTGRLQNRSHSSGRSHIGLTAVIALVISVLIILENLLVLVAVLSRICRSRRWIYVCIANITLSDLLTGASYVVNICMSGNQTFRLSPELWLFREGLLFVALAASIFSLLLIAVERYMAMMKPLHQKAARKTYRIYAMVVLCWILASAMGFLPLFGWNCVCSLESCSTLLPLYSKSYIFFTLLIFFLILLTIGALYGAIYCHVRGSIGSQRRRTMELLKTVISIVGVFMVCWAPLFILLLVDYFCDNRQCTLLFSPDWFIAMAVLNSALNPIIYAAGCNDLRRAIVELLCCCCLKTGVCHLDSYWSKETSSTSESRRDSLRNSFNKIRNLSVVSPPPTPRKSHKASKKYRLSSTTTCLSVSSG